MTVVIVRADFADPQLVAFLEAPLADLAPTAPDEDPAETGTAAFFVPARAFYAPPGFVSCAPFANYAESPHSTYLTLALI